MLKPEEKEALLRLMKEALSSEALGIVFGYVHGSFVKSQTFRDIDVALFIEGKGELTYESDLSAKLTAILGDPVEVKVINEAPVAFQAVVLRDGKLLFSRGEGRRASFIEEVGKRYREYSHFRNLFLEVAVFDQDRIAKDREDILTMKRQIEEILALGEDAFLRDKRSPLALKYLLIEEVEAITDICQHLLARVKGIACMGYVDCIVKGGEHGIISPDLANKLRRLADLRNSLIHRYGFINDGELFKLCKENLGDFDQFIVQIDRFVKKDEPISLPQTLSKRLAMARTVRPIS
ncbi:MAG: DUF86 domain-containing protein [Desulfobacterota bacterium]|nr:DUF86 domain-containing protein [Thermodesulfobacteriota bacterium]